MCDCYEKINQQLATRNTRLTPGMIWKSDTIVTRMIVATEKVDAKKVGKPATIFGAYCPFCGEKQGEGE
jgi:hypothetical protein